MQCVGDYGGVGTVNDVAQQEARDRSFVANGAPRDENQGVVAENKQVGHTVLMQ